MTDEMSDTELDALLARLPVEAPSEALRRRILDAAPRPRRRSTLDVFADALSPGGRRWPAGAALASLGVGLLVGYAGGAAQSAPDLEADAAIYASLGVEAGYLDFVEDGF